MQNDSFAIECIQKYINHDVIKNMLKIENWQGYMIQLTLPYKEGNIEGGLFVFYWLARMLNIKIHLWSSKIGKMTTSVPSFTQPSKVLDIVEIQRDIVVYVPLTNVQISTNKKLKLFLIDQSQETLSLRNVKSFIQSNALQQQLHNIVNKSESSTTQTKTINSIVH